MTTSERKEKLVKIFIIDGPPYLLRYRRLGRGRKDWIADIPALSELMKEGVVKEIERTRTTVLYHYQPTL